MEYTDIVSSSDKGIARITINRPDRHNVFRLRTVEELIDGFERADADTDVGVVVLTGAGDKAFSSNRTLLSGDLCFAERANAWLFATRDTSEGMAAFREKREPAFHGR